MGKLKKLWRRLRKKRKAHPITPEGDRPTADAPPNRQARSENSPDPLLKADPVLHDGPDDSPDGSPGAKSRGLAGNPDTTSPSHQPSDAIQSPSPCPTLLDPRASSASEPANTQAQSCREQDKQASSQVFIGSLWSEAADGLDTCDQEKLDYLITPGREGPSVDDVDLVLHRAKQLEAKDDTWSPVKQPHPRDPARIPNGCSRSSTKSSKEFSHSSPSSMPP